MRDVIKTWLRQTLTPTQVRKCKRAYASVLSRFLAADLTRLAILHGTDKWNHHWYTQHYQRHFSERRKGRLNILEIGVGGYQDPFAGGSSLRMWKYYFPNSNIYGVDLNDKTALEESRIKIFQGNQNDENFLKDVFNQIGSLDIIIDDGSHVNEHVIFTFKTLFPLLNSGGIYAVEDTEHSYWREFGGDSQDLNNPGTMMNFFKSLTDGLNHEDVKSFMPGFEPSYFNRNILSIHFYHNLILLYKGLERPQSAN